MTDPQIAQPAEKEEKLLVVTIRTPAGIPHQFHVNSHERVSIVTPRAVEYFVAHHQLDPGSYGLALIRDGRAIEMLDSARLEDYDVDNDDVLALVAKVPPVDAYWRSNSTRFGNSSTLNSS